MARYFLDDTDYLYFHSYMSDYFLGTYGGGGFSSAPNHFVSGILKPFRYTEIQKHTFHLKSKDDNKDRQVRVLIQDIVSFMLFRCPPCHWPSTTDRES